MFPIRDSLPTRTPPLFTYGLIGANLLLYLLLAPHLDRAVWDLGALSFQYTGTDPVLPRALEVQLYREGIPLPGAAALPEIVLRTLAHMFVHGGLLHLLGNLWFLWIFADNVEDRLGRPRFLLLYLLSGLGALTAQVLATPASAVPMVGASGAISGVLGAYLLLFPHARIVTLVPLGFLPLIFLIPARLFLLYWFGLQFVFGVASNPMAGGVAFWAHIGGFAVGLLLAKPLAPPRRRIRVDIKPPPPPYRSQGMPFALLIALALTAQTPGQDPHPTEIQRSGPIPRHRPDLRYPPPAALEHLQKGNLAHVEARSHKQPTRPLPRPAGSGRYLAVVHICADLALDVPALLGQYPTDLLVLSSPGPLIRSPEAALVERAATTQNVTLTVILTHENCPSLQPGPDTPANKVLERNTDPSRHLAHQRHISTALAHAHLQAENLFAISETLRHLRDDNQFATVIGVVDEKTHAIRWR